MFAGHVLVIIVDVDVLLPNGARPSTGTVLTTKSDISFYIWRLQCQKQVSRTGTSNYISLSVQDQEIMHGSYKFLVGCDYLSLFVIPAPGTHVPIYTIYVYICIYMYIYVYIYIISNTLLLIRGHHCECPTKSNDYNDTSKVQMSFPSFLIYRCKYHPI